MKGQPLKKTKKKKKKGLRISLQERLLHTAEMYYLSVINTQSHQLLPKMYAIQNISDEPIYVGVKEGARLSGKRGTKHQVLELS